jgi:hypothetical protein
MRSLTVALGIIQVLKAILLELKAILLGLSQKRRESTGGKIIRKYLNLNHKFRK